MTESHTPTHADHSQSGLVALLERATVDAPPPPVSDLQLIGRRHRQMMTISAGAVVALVIAGALVVALAIQQGIGDDLKIETVDNDPLVEDSTNTTSTLVDVSPMPAEGRQEAEQDAAQMDADMEAIPGWSIVSPGDGWELRSISSTRWVDRSARQTRYVLTDEGDMGPLVVIWHNVDMNTRDYQDGPREWIEETSPGGRTVRLGVNQESGQQTAIFLTEIGSVALTGFDVPQTTLLAITDTVSAAGNLTVDGDALPSGYVLAPEPGTDIVGPRKIPVEYYLRRSDTMDLRVLSLPNNGNVLDQIWGLRYQDDVSDVVINGNRVLIAPSAIQGSGPEIVVLTDDFVYHIHVMEQGPNAEPPGVTDLQVIVEQLAPVDEASLLASNPDLAVRADTLDRWISDVGLPDDYNLDWMWDGPPIAQSEAFYVFQLVHCAWVHEWAETGDPAILDRLEQSSEWASAQDYVNLMIAVDDELTNADRLQANPAMLFAEEVAAARSTSPDAERQDTEAFSSCGWTESMFE